MRKISIVLAAMLLALAISANAGVIDHSADAVNNTTGWTAVGQTFTSIGGTLTGWQFWLGSTVPQINFYVCSGDVQAGCGTPLYTTILTNVSASPVVLSGINVPTTAGNLYSVLYDLNGYSGASVLWSSNSYPGPGGWGEWGYGSSVSDQWSRTLGTGFIATFGATTPEPGTLALLGSGMLAGLGALRRKILR